MATRKRKSKKYAAVVGIAGGANVSIKAARAHLSDFIEGRDGEILWVLPHTEDATKSLNKVKEFLWDEDAEYVLVSDGTLEDEEWEDHAQKVFEVDGDVYAALITEVAGHKADELGVIFLFDENLQSDGDLVDAALSEGLRAVDLGAGLAELEIEVIDEEDEPELEELDDDDSEDDSEDDDTSDDEDSEDEGQGVDIPDDILQLIAAGDEDGAVEALKEFDRDDLVDIADELGIKVKKGSWASTVAKDIVAELATDDAPEPEEEPEPEPEPVKEKAPKKAKDAAPKKDAPEKDTPAKKDTQEESAPITSDPMRRSAEFDVHLRTEAIRATAWITAEKGAAEAELYLDLLKDRGII